MSEILCQRVRCTGVGDHPSSCTGGVHVQATRAPPAYRAFVVRWIIKPPHYADNVNWDQSKTRQAALMTSTISYGHGEDWRRREPENSL